MKPPMRFGLALALVAGVGACSESTGPSYDSSVDAVGAEMAADAAWSSVHEMMAGLASGGLAAPEAAARLAAARQKAFAPIALSADRLPRGYRADLARMPDFAPGPNGATLSAPPGCSITESGMDGGGDPIDANANGIPDDYRMSMHCEFSEEVAPDSNVTQKVEVEVSFVERMGDLLGFDLKVRQLVQVSTNFGVFQKQEQIQEQGISLRSDRAGTHDLNSIELRVKPDAETPEVHVEVYQRGDMRFTPDTPISPEAALPDGEVTLGGEFRYINTDEDVALRFVLDTPEPLQFSNACDSSDDQPFVDGVLRGRFNGRSSVGFTIRFNECGVGADYETFGLEEGVPAARPFHP
jgi:hypothetical protein